MKNARVFGADAGKANLVIYDGDNIFTCPSTFAKGVDKLDEGYQVLFNGSKYLIGDKTLAFDLEMTKEKEQHKVMMYFGIAQLIKQNEHCSIITSCPADIYINKALRQSFVNYLLPETHDGKVIITTGITTKVFYIDEITVIPEGVGVVYNQPELFLDELVGVIDIGGTTTNCLLFDDATFIRNKSFTETNGMHFLTMKIRDALKKEGRIVDDLEVKYYLKDPGEYKFLIDSIVNGFIDEIYRFTVARNWGDKRKILLSGGGSVALEEKLKAKFPDSTISIDALYDNCKGNYQFGVMLCQQGEQKQ
ncbi:MAG: ParM/StbA family protein [Turicibacter sp.]|nr:ParM/StbA family protein [Turicibacter sp.]